MSTLWFLKNKFYRHEYPIVFEKNILMVMSTLWVLKIYMVGRYGIKKYNVTNTIYLMRFTNTVRLAETHRQQIHTKKICIND